MKGPSGGAAAFIKANVAVTVLAALFTVFLIAMVALGILGARHAQFDAESFALSSEQRLLSQQIAANALEAADGSAEASVRLGNFIRRFEQTLDLLESGNPETGLPPAEHGVADALARVRGQWTVTRAALDTILESREVIAGVREIGDQINESIPRLIAASDRVVTTMVEKNIAADAIYIASRQLLLAQRLEANVHRMLLGGTYAATAADRFGRDAALFGRVLSGLLEGSAALELPQQRDQQIVVQLQQVEDLFGGISELVGRMLESSAQMFQVIDASDEMESMSRELLAAATGLEEELRTHQHTQTLYYNFAGLSAVMMVLSLTLLGYLLVRSARRRLDEQAEQNSRNQRAILRLLDELTNLADGDLTTHATVTEDITGAIADSVNYAIDALRSLVTSINRTSALVSESAETTGQTALSLSDASTKQAAEIASASAAIDDMAKSMKNVSANAESSADVAMKSVDIASKGADTVRLSIDGMDNIREQIQQTSKRIKRLGESSQEVGDIIGLINEIADQTNILALNAAIQASTAGEAGRGFAVVADEVQRLAERAGAATKRVEALVKTIQADTNEAVASMEQSTAGVVSGAKLAEDAGEALVEIESVSKRLASLIQNISKEASEQADAATLLANAMNAIRDITMQTSSGTASTAESIGNLAELSHELRESVAGFKLPEGGEDPGINTSVMRAFSEDQ